MNHIDTDLAPPPEDTLMFTRLRGGGWLLIHDGQSQVAFSSAADMIDWLRTHIEPLEAPNAAPPITMPSILEAAQPEHRGVWRIFSGGQP